MSNIYSLVMRKCVNRHRVYSDLRRDFRIYKCYRKYVKIGGGLVFEAYATAGRISKFSNPRDPFRSFIPVDLSIPPDIFVVLSNIYDRLPSEVFR